MLGYFTTPRDINVCIERCYQVLPKFDDVLILYVAWFSVWMLPYLTLRWRTLIHSRVPNSAEHTKVEYRVPPNALVYLCNPGHDNYPCLHRPLPSKTNTPNGNPHNPSSNNQHLTTWLPTLNLEIWPMPLGPPAEALQHPFLPLANVTTFRHKNGPEANFNNSTQVFFVGETNVSYAVNTVQMFPDWYAMVNKVRFLIKTFWIKKAKRIEILEIREYFGDFWEF